MAKLTELQKRFVREFLVDPNGTRAYMRAKAPQTVTYATAATEAGKLLKMPQVSSEIDAAGKALFNMARLKGVNVVKGLSKIAFADILDFTEEDADGKEQLRQIRDIPYRARLAVQSIKSRVVSVKRIGEGTPEEVLRTTTLVEIRLNDRVAALDKLMKYMGKYEKDNQQKNQPLTPQEVEAIKERLRQRGFDVDRLTASRN